MGRAPELPSEVLVAGRASSFSAVIPGEVPSGVLVVGYGNPLRGDDAVGQRVVEELERSVLGGAVTTLKGARFVLADCLLPELAVEVGAFGLVVFVDAAHGLPAGVLTLRALGPKEAPGPGSCWQDLTPAGVLGLTLALYGRVPEALLLRVGAACVGLGEGLSPEVSASVPLAVAASRAAIAAWAPPAYP